MDRRLKSSLVYVLRAFVYLFSISFACLFSCVIVYGVFSIALFIFSFLICLGLCAVSCFLGQEQDIIPVVIVTCSTLFIAASVLVVLQIGCSSGQQGMCMILVWNVENTSNSPRGIEERKKSANILLLCTDIAQLLFAGALDLYAWQLKRIPHEVVAAPGPQSGNFQCTIPAVQMREVRNQFSSEACSVCQEPFADHHSVVLLSCGHLYHYTCINEWVSRAQVCPNCRSTITEVELIPTPLDKEESQVAPV